jgi:hypothetical protein
VVRRVVPPLTTGQLEAYRGSYTPHRQLSTGRPNSEERCNWITWLARFKNNPNGFYPGIVGDTLGSEKKALPTDASKSHLALFRHASGCDTEPFCSLAIVGTATSPVLRHSPARAGKVAGPGCWRSRGLPHAELTWVSNVPLSSAPAGSYVPLRARLGVRVCRRTRVRLGA